MATGAHKTSADLDAILRPGAGGTQQAAILNCLACGSHFKPKTDEKFCSQCLYWQQFMPQRVTR